MFRLMTERLFLRQFQTTDREPMYRIFCDADVMRFSDGVKTKEWVQAWLETCLERYQIWGFGPYAVVEQSSQNVIGYCGLFFFPDLAGKAETEIGYRLARSTWGQGYATEAGMAALRWADEVLKPDSIPGIIDLINRLLASAPILC